MPTEDEEEFRKFEELGLSAVRKNIAAGRYGQKTLLAQEWVRRQEEVRSDAAYADQASLASRAAEADERAASAAERAATAAERAALEASLSNKIAQSANAIARVALTIAMIALAVTAIAAVVGHGAQ